MRQLGILFVIAAFLNFTVGCTSTSTKAVGNAEITSKEKIVSVILLDGTVIRYSEAGASLRTKFQDRAMVVVGMTQSGSIAATPLDSILEARVERSEANVAGTILTTIGVVALVIGGIALIALATKQSCPFVYSFDGTKYQFDAEPLGGAITEGLKRTDFSRLECLKPASGQYQLMVRNEARETQYTDQLNLLLFDHSPSSTIAPDFTGNFFSFSHTIPPLSAFDENGRDVRTFFTSSDNVKWQSTMPTDTSFRTQDLRHHLTFTFPKPTHATSMALLVNAGTAQWGSNMIREMLMLRGKKVDDWYKNVDAHGQELQNLLFFMDREELFTLKVNVWEGQSWVPRGLMHAGGPLIDEDRIVDVDVSHVEGDTVRFQINPPRGYWKIDCINALEAVNPVVPTAEVFASFGQDQAGNDITGLLRSTDNRYYTMREVGDRCELRYPVPAQAEGTVRTMYLKASGYYTLHLPKDTPEQTAMIQEFGLTPGKIVLYSLERYLQWHQQLMSSMENRQ